MFVTTLGMDNFDCTKMNAHFQKFTACLSEGLIHEWKHAFPAPPFPLMSVNNSWLCSTQIYRLAPFAVGVCVLTTIFYLTRSMCMGPRPPTTRLGICMIARPWSTQLIQSWPLWAFCCLYTQTCFHKQALRTTHSYCQYSTLLTPM